MAKQLKPVEIEIDIKFVHIAKSKSGIPDTG
jgi:hypothetical protein